MKVSAPFATLVNCVGVAVPVLPASGFGFTKAVFNGVSDGLIDLITVPSAVIGLPSLSVPAAGVPSSASG